MIPCLIAALFIIVAIFIPLVMLVAPIIMSLMVFAAKVTMVVIPVITLLMIFVAVQKSLAEERAREAARIAEAERQRLRRQRELEAALLRAERQAEAARRAAVPRRPVEYPPGAAGWFMRAMDTIATASSGSCSVSDYDPQPVYNAPHNFPRVVAPPAATTTADPVMGGDCAVCCDRAANTLLMPCKHLALCGVCWDRMNSVKSSNSSVRCPFCRGAVVEKITVFRN